jgi:hypothetical protein
MKRKSKIMFVATTIFILFCLMIQPAVLADEVHDMEYEVSYYTIPYGNGIDDDGDGVIDNIEEEDVEYGEVNLSDLNSNIYQWNDTFQTEHGEWNVTDNGIAIAAVHDQVWDIQSSSNASIAPETDICYKFDYNANDQYENGHGGLQKYVTVSDKMIPAVKFNVEFKPTDIMNGASMTWYRSPIAYDPDAFEGHVLNIYRVSDDELIWANLNNSYDVGKTFTPYWADYPKFKADNSTTGVMSEYERIYYRLNVPLQSGVEYRFEEFLKVQDDVPQNSIKLYMAPGQDIADDGNQRTYIFSDTSNARMIPAEASWSILFKVGRGMAGTEIAIPATQHFDVLSDVKKGGMNNVKSVRVIIPFRTTALLDDVRIDLHVMSGGSEIKSDPPNDIDAVGGTVIFDFNIDDPDPGEINYYQLEIRFDPQGGEGTATDSDTIYINLYPSDGDGVVIGNYGLFDGKDLFFCSQALQFDIIESGDALEEADYGTTTEVNWVAVGLILIGAVLMIVAPYIGYSVMTAGVISSTTLSIAAGIIAGGTTFTVGAYLASQGFRIGEGGNFQSFFEWTGSGIARISTGIMDGINVLVGGLINAIVEVAKALVYIGEQIVYYTSIIVEAVAELIWLLAFLVVIWIWSKFLGIMKQITLGNPEGALTAIAQPIARAATVTRKGVKIGIKTSRKAAAGAKRTKRWYDSKRKPKVNKEDTDEWRS